MLCYWAKLLALAAMSLLLFVLIEILSQLIFPATFKARFYGIDSVAIQEVRANLSRWHKSNPQYKVELHGYGSEVDLGQGRMVLTFDAIETDFDTVSRLISAVEPSSFDGALSISRAPSSVAKTSALLLSAIFFVAMSLRTFMHGNDRRNDGRDSFS